MWRSPIGVAVLRATTALAATTPLGSSGRGHGRISRYGPVGFPCLSWTLWQDIYIVACGPLALGLHTVVANESRDWRINQSNLGLESKIEIYIKVRIEIEVEVGIGIG